LSINVSAQNCSVNAGVPETICANEILILDGSKTGSFSGSGETTWSQVSGPTVTIVNPNNLITAVTNFTGNNVYVFRLSTTCEDGTLLYQDVIKTVLPISPAHAGVDAIYCPGTKHLAANPLLPGESGLWTGMNANSNGITVSDPTAYNSQLVIAGNRSGTATLTWTVTNANGCTSTDVVAITNRGGLPVSAGPDKAISHCYSSTQSTRLEGSYAGSGIDGQSGVWSIISGPNIPTFSNVSAYNTNVSNLIQGNYIFRWTVSGPCVNGYDEVTVTVPAPTADITTASIIGGDQMFCDPRSSTILSGNTPSYINETVLWTKTNGPDPVSFANSTSSVTEVSGLDGSSTYTFTYRISNAVTNCYSEADVDVEFFPNAPTIEIELPSDQILTDCDVHSIEIPFSFTGSGTNQYRILSGPITAGLTIPTEWSNAGSSPLTVQHLDSLGTYVIQMRRYTTIGVSCGTAYDEVSVITSLPPSLSNAGTSQILNCNINNSSFAHKS